MGREQKPTRLLTRTGQWLVYALFRCVEAVLSMLPLVVVWYLGRFIGTLVYPIAGSYRKLALNNLRIAFEGEKSEAERRAIAREHFKSLFANFFCGLKMPLMGEKNLLKHVSCEGITELEAFIQREKKPIVNLVLHASCWELLTQVPTTYVRGHKPGAIYQPIRNPFLNDLVLRRRQKLNFVLFDRTKGFNGPMKFIREGGQVGVLVDQHAGDHGLWCPFFGRLSSTTPIAALMAMRTDSAVVPMMIYDDGPARWKLVAAPAVTSAQEGAEALTNAINTSVEQLIRRQPASWFWVHARWKTANPGILISAYKRGVVLPEGMTVEQLKPFHMLIRSPNWLGDACMAFPMVRAIKRGRPDLQITVIGPDKLEELWLSMPEVSRYIAKPAKEGVFAVAKRIKATGIHFDAAVLCTNSTRSTLEIWLAGIPRLVGFRGSLRSKMLHQLVPEPQPGGPIEHHARRYMRLAAHIGADLNQEGLWDAPPPELPDDGVIRIGVCAGAEYGPAKRWPMERFAEVVNSISSKYAKVHWQLFGAPGEKEMGEKLSAMLQAPHENLVGKTRLTELIAKLRACTLLLTNDTGTMHLAAALGVPTVSVFGSTCPIATGPLGDRHIVIQHKVPCAPCFERQCPFGHYDCMTKVTPAEVAEAVIKAASLG